MIIICALLFIAWRYQKNDRQRPIDAEYETSAEKFRYEMQRSADEVISRMNERIDRLEKLVEEADQRSAQLEWQLTQLNDGNGYIAQRQYETVPVVKDETGFSNILEKSLAEEDFSVASGAIQSVRAINAYQSAPIPETFPEAQQEEELSVPVEDLPPADNVSVYQEEAVVEHDFSITDQNEPLANNDLKTAMVRQLIKEGLATEEIARRVHLGKNAIELIRQMEESSIKR